ncbi:MAG: response regulator [Nitrospirota bacterium]
MTKKILIVDDDQSILKSFSYLFSSNETMVVMCKGLEEAMAAVSHYTFDLVISDIRLGGSSDREGLELLSYVKKICPRTAVILMTAYSSQHIREDAYWRGAFHYYEKPIDLIHLDSKVKSLGINLLSS